MCVFHSSLSLTLSLSNSSQIFDESTWLQNFRLERQQTLQKRQLKELRRFAETFSNDRSTTSSSGSGSERRRDHAHQSPEISSVNSESSLSNSSYPISMGTANV